MPKNPGWTTEELSIAVEAYLDMFEDDQCGRHVNKAATFRDLAAGRLSQRTKSSVEFRFRNISSVLSGMGLPLIQGLLPQSHAGANVASELERLIASSLEDRMQASTFRWQAVVEQAVAWSSGPPISPSKRSAEASTVPSGRQQPWQIRLIQVRHARDPKVAEWVRARAAGHCESCGRPAPFSAVAANGSTYPFLEVHHIRRLADGGSDRVTNAVAVCPNCHRELHFGAEATAKRDALYGRLACLITED